MITLYGALLLLCSIVLLSRMDTMALPAAGRRKLDRNWHSAVSLPNLPDHSKLAQTMFGSGTKKQQFLKIGEVKVPQYMLDLFEAVTDNNGIKRKGVFLAGNIVRSFYSEAPSLDSDVKLEYSFNVADISLNETIHKAELRLYKHKAKKSQKGRKNNHYFYRVDIRDNYSGRTIEAKLVSSKGFGWETFTLTKEVKAWVSNPMQNKGIQVLIKGNHNGKPHFRFAHTKEVNKEPILVVFSDTVVEEQKKGLKNYREEVSNYARRPRNMQSGAYVDIAFDVHQKDSYFVDYLYAAELINQKYYAANSTKKLNRKMTHASSTIFDKKGAGLDSRERSKLTQAKISEKMRFNVNVTDTMLPASEDTKHGNNTQSGPRKLRGSENYYQESISNRRHRVKCRREDMFVDVDKISWSKMILQPKIFNAYRCTGSCNVYSSSQRGRQTTHATIQAILSLTGIVGNENVPMPCCAPEKLEPMSLLFYERKGETIVVKLQSIDDMVVKSCACL